MGKETANGKRLLLVSPTPTHPHHAGNRQRVYMLSEHLRQIFDDVYFLFLAYEKADHTELERYWGSSFQAYSSEETRYRQKPEQNLFRFITRPLLRLKYSRDQLHFNYRIDEWFDDRLLLLLQDLQQRHRFTHVLVEYVFLSKVFCIFDHTVFKALDTHDVFTDRYKVYRQNHQKPRWFSTFHKEEMKGCRRADLVITLQEEERRFFESSGLPNVKTVGHLTRPSVDLAPPTDTALLFVSGRNPINLEGLRRFVDEVLPRVRKRHPNIRLLLAGSICEVIPNDPGYEKLGLFDDPREVYRLSDIVINPVSFGTGLKIKTIEALSMGKIVVGDRHGIIGLEPYEPPYYTAGTPEQYLSHFDLLLGNDRLLMEEKQRAVTCISRYTEDQVHALKSIFQ
jgi:glycosyltransferase involved in cell wall biosynthesis